MQYRDLSNLNLSSHKWDGSWVTCALDIVWRAYDRLVSHYIEKGRKLKDDSEDEITSSLVRLTNIIKNYSFARFSRLIDFHNQPPDKSRRRNRKVNTNDIGVFFKGEIEKPEFIFESKKIDRLTLKAEKFKGYLEDLDAFLTDYYGSHLSESALISYLHTGTIEEMFELIETSLSQKLKKLSEFISRPHKTSEHKKTFTTATHPNFLCHHLIFEML